MSNLKTSVKITNLVIEALVAHRGQENPHPGHRRSAVSSLQHLLGLCRKIEKCSDRFPLAKARLESELACVASDCRFRLESMSRQPRKRKKLPSMREVVGELQALQTEFEKWSFDPEEQSLSIETEPIELEGVPLGPFQVRLDLNKLASIDSNPVYKVIALDPSPPACNENVTHPHVRDNLLCEGDASSSIDAALLDGRLCDFFLLVASVLRTYNPSSPYVKLENWEGVPCYDCGCVVDGDHRVQCQGCENDFCDDCVSSCVQCGFTACHSCLGVCDLCGSEICDGCREKCSKCEETYCASCVKDSVCVTCKEKDNEKAEMEETCV
jgi:hypothetical protein